MVSIFLIALYTKIHELSFISKIGFKL